MCHWNKRIISVLPRLRVSVGRELIVSYENRAAGLGMPKRRGEMHLPVPPLSGVTPEMEMGRSAQLQEGIRNAARLQRNIGQLLRRVRYFESFFRQEWTRPFRRIAVKAMVTLELTVSSP